MSELNKVVLCLEKNENKNLGQNPDNLKHFFMKDFNYDCKKVMKMIGEAIPDFGVITAIMLSSRNFRWVVQVGL